MMKTTTDISQDELLLFDIPGHGPDQQKLKDWLKVIDRDQDGCITRKELRDALKASGMKFSLWRAWQAVLCSDLNRNGMVDGDKEVEKLVAHLKKKQWFKVKG